MDEENNSLFGDLGKTPDPVPDNLLMDTPIAIPLKKEEHNSVLSSQKTEASSKKPDNYSGEIEYESPELSEMGLAPEDQLADHEYPGASMADPDEDEWARFITEDLVSLYDFARQFAHPWVFAAVNYSKQEMEEYETLHATNDRDNTQENRYQWLHKRIIYREKERVEFNQRVPYNQNQKKRIERVLGRVIEKISRKGVPLWLAIIFAFVVPEVILVGHCYLVKANTPK